MTSLALRRTAGPNGTRFAAIRDGRELGYCKVVQNLTHGGALPALHGWADLWEIRVREGWRNQGIGGWLLRHAISWLRLSGCDRIVINVGEDDEAAGRFYRRFGWGFFTWEIQPWNREAPPDTTSQAQ
jgi:GNAT superfamily N-acetyltransferase